MIRLRFSMRILFTDLDGVVHPGPKVATGLTHFCWLPDLSRMLASWADIRLVIHSTWRHQYDLSELREMLGPLSSRVLDVTVGPGRWGSIEGWLSRNPSVRSFRVLDDEPDEFPHPPPSELILCRADMGISEPAVQVQLRDWLEA